MKSDVNPMHSAPRCTAKSKRTGEPCKSPAVRGWKVCRMHGAHGGAGSGRAHPNYCHGMRSREAVELRAIVAALVKQS
jgi:hypothetical protein